METSEDVKDFEKGRIRALQEERLHIQKKTFTKWMNSFLQKARMEVDDLFTDLADGKKLLKLLEIISGEKLGKPNSGKMRVHRVENVNKSLAFLHTKVRLENIGAEDIVDGNPRMILGLIWTIILRFQIQEIEIDVDDESETSEKKSAKDALLLWCQRKTNGYQNVEINNFSSSWTDGLGFNALIHHHRPDLISFNQLKPDDHIGNLRNAFEVAEKHLGIPRLLDPEDVDIPRPDEKSVITYVASYYHTFSKMKAGATGGKRIGNIVSKIRDIESQKVHFETYTSQLMQWIRSTTIEMKKRNFPNTLEEIQHMLKKFKEYRMVEKPPKYKEKVDIEATYFDIQIKLQQLRQAPYVPPEDQRPHDIEQAWQVLEREEHLREVALKEELLRQEKLEQLAFQFERKSVLREGYLNEMIQVLSDPRYGSNLNQVMASVKKHEAISADILARKERFKDLSSMCEQLQKENYHAKEHIQDREKLIMRRWQELLDLLKLHKDKLERYCTVINLQRDIETLMVTIKHLQGEFSSGDSGSHLLDVQEKLQKFHLQESQVNAMAETIKKVHKQAKGIQAAKADAQDNMTETIQSRLSQLDNMFQELVEMCRRRQVQLEDTHAFYQLVQDLEEEGQWVDDKLAICTAPIQAKDLRALTSLQQKHKAMEDEMSRRHGRFMAGPLVSAEELISAGHPESKQLKDRCDNVQKKWENLKLEASKRRSTLESSTDAYQFFSDCNETESVVKECLTIAKSKDFGQDKLTALSLLQRHKQLHEKIQSLEVDVARVEETGNKLKNSQISAEAIFLTADPGKQEETEKVVAVEVWEDEPFERTEIQKVIEDRKVPQVMAIYQYSGHGLEVKKKETMFLLDKTNADWWNIRKYNGEHGFVPANYVKEIEPKLVSVEVKKPIVIKDTRKVKKTQYVKQKIQPSGNQKSGKEVINEKQDSVRESYALLQKLSKERQMILQNSLKLFDFYSESEDFNKWLKDKTKAITTEEKDVAKATKAFEKFLTDFSANKKRLEQLDASVRELEIIFPEHRQDILTRQKETHRLYDNLVRAQETQEKNLEGFASVIFFVKTCEDVCDWITEKSEKLDMDDLAKDLTTVKALQRKHKGLERELAPIKDKVGQVTQLGRDVILSFPHERNNIEERTKDLQAKWEMLESRAGERSRRLEDAVGMQLFVNGVRSLLQWVDETRATLQAREHVRDVQTAEELLNQHSDIGDTIKTKQDEFSQLIGLGEKMYLRQPSQDNEEKINNLKQQKEAIQQDWFEKGEWLKQVRDLQLFNREADQLEAATSAQAKFLDNITVGDNFEDVDAFIKRHEDFSATLVAQEDRVNAFKDTAANLLSTDHPDSAAIVDKRDRVLRGRDKLKNDASNKRGELDESKVFNEFRTAVQEMMGFIGDKKRLTREDSFRDQGGAQSAGPNLANLKVKTKKQEVLEGEIKANAGQLKVLNRTGQQMINRNHFKAAAVGQDLEKVNSAWEELVVAVKDQGARLKQAEAQKDYNMMASDVRAKLEDIEKQIANQNLGDDMRDCKKLLSQHAAAEQELDLVDQKIGGLSTVATDLADGHFDAANIMHICDQLSAGLEALKSPAKARKEALNLSLRYHEFMFDLNRELEWIGEKRSILSSWGEIKNLSQAQSSVKKHRKLEEEVNNHEVVINKVLQSGQSLLDSPDFRASKEVISNSENLKSNWSDLLGLVSTKKDQLQLALKAQEFYFEVGDIETWIGEKTQTLNGTDYGKDEDKAVKLLTKHKGLELEVDTYSGIIQELNTRAAQLVAAGHPDAKEIRNRDNNLSRELKNLKKDVKDRRDKLVLSIQLHEYRRESSEFQEWVNQQMSTAKSQDVGQDYEHMELLLARFQEFKLRVQAGEEKFKVCENLAKRLENVDPSLSTDLDVRQVQAALTDRWYELIKTIEERDKALESAGEVHRFNRDIGEALSRIQEKEAILQNKDTGRDTKSVQSLIRKHEGFENDLVALEAQLQVLIDDSATLQAKYPGENATHIAQQQKTVVSHWTSLQEHAAARKAALLSSNDYFTFTGMVRDLLAWSSSLRRSLITEEKVSDAASAQMLKAEHDNLKAEIETREKIFSEVVALGEAMVADKHPAAAEVKEKIDAVLAERQKLHTAWQHKKVYLDQLIDIHFYLRDAKAILASSTAQEIALSNTECGNTIEEVEAHLKAHDAFQNLVGQQEEKVASLKEHADKLVKQQHYNTKTIQAKLAEILEKRSTVAELCTHKTNLLNLNYLYAKFMQDFGEEMAWIEEKRRKLSANNKTVDDTNLSDKIKLLQKHQTLQAEIDSHKPQIMEVAAKGNRLVQKRHENSYAINQHLTSLNQAWEDLIQQSTLISKGLEEAKGILDFNNEVANIESWIRDKELMISQGDTGKDYEHCMELRKKLDDVDSNMRVDESYITKVIQMGNKLCKEAGAESENIAAKQSGITDKWRSLQGAIQDYRESLHIASNIHAFQRDTDETLSRIREKLLLVDSDDKGKDLKDVKDLLKKLDGVDEYMAGLEKRIEEHEAVSKDLVSQYPDSTSSIVQGKMETLTSTWSSAKNRLTERRNSLEDSFHYHKFVADCREVQTWLLDMDKKVKAVVVPTEGAEVEAFAGLHQERKAEIAARKEMLVKLRQTGEILIAESRQSPELINAELEKSEEIQENVEQSWEQTRKQLLFGNQMHLFREHTLRTIAWLEEKEAFLNNDDLGDNLAAVEALVRKHQGFLTTLEKQSSCIKELEDKAADLCDQGHSEADKINEMVAAVKARLDVIKDKCEARMEKLNDSRHLHQFLRKVFDIKTWVREKTQVALDDSYLDMANLQNKIQKHTSFEAEIAANKPRLQAIQEEGSKLLCGRDATARSSEHFAATEIAAQLDDLQSEWSHLLDTSALKRNRLHEADSAVIYLHGLEEVEMWLEEVEQWLESDEHGRDLNSTAKLLKRLATIESEVNARRSLIKSLEDQCAKFSTAKHFMAEELEARYSGVGARFEALGEPLHIRRNNLEDSLTLHQLNRSVADETFWLEEKLPLASSGQLGSSLAEVQQLQQKHQLLEGEVLQHEKTTNQLIEKAEGMIRAQHFASDDIKETILHLREGYNQLKDLCAIRKLRLSDALESQQFFFKLKDCMDWLKEKEPILKVKDVKNDEDSVQIYLKKAEDILDEMEGGYRHKVEGLEVQAAQMVDRGHFDSTNIQARMAELKSRYDTFHDSIASQKKSLVDQMAVIEFFHEAEDVIEWINSQMVTAASEDYGKDVSHVEILIKSFHTFMAGIEGGDARVQKVLEQSSALQAAENTHAAIVREKVGELEQLWEDLKELSAARQEALNGAKQVHVFDKNADETISWINEKEAEISTDELGQDLETIQSLVERQEGLQRDLAAIQQQVQEVEKEAGVLCELFPDAAAHINSKQEQTKTALTNLIVRSKQRETRLQDNQQIQRYFDDYRELMAWSSEVIAKITSPDLATDLAGAKTLISRHKEIRTEMDSRQDAFKRFETEGEALVSDGHFMAAEIREKIASLAARKEKMVEAWQLREELYLQHLDYLKWAKETDTVDGWITSREPTIKDSNLGSSIEEVEDLLRQQQDFEGAIAAQETKLDAVNRITLIERNFAALREREEAARAEEVRRAEAERLEAIKRKELARINNERRRENERRRTQEIKFNREDFEGMRNAAAAAGGGSQGSGSAGGTSSHQNGGQNGYKSDSSSGVTSPAGGADETVSLNPFFNKRGESLRVGSSLVDPSKKLGQRRTPSFTTRRRTQSFRRHAGGAAANRNLAAMQNLPPVEMDGFLERKQELQSGGKRATVRSWKSYYTVLCGQLMCFFRDQEDFFESKASSPPIMIYQSSIDTANDYTKKSFVFRLHVTDGSEYLFSAESEAAQEEWVKKLKFHASLPPSQQLTSYNSAAAGIGLGAAGGADPATGGANDVIPEVAEKENVPANSESQEPVYVNTNMASNIPPLPVSHPPPQMYGAAGAKHLLGRKSTSGDINSGDRRSMQDVSQSSSMFSMDRVSNNQQYSSRISVVSTSSTTTTASHLHQANNNHHHGGYSEPDSGLDNVSLHSNNNLAAGATASVNTTSSKEKKSSVLGRFLRKKP